MSRFNNYPTPEDTSGDDSLQYFPSQNAMEAAHNESLIEASEEGLSDDAAAAREHDRARQLDLPDIINGTGPYKKI